MTPPLIHKRAFPLGGTPLGVHEVPGHARTIGRDGDGNLAVWYETDILEYAFQVLWTGQELVDGFTLIDCFNHQGSVRHLAVPKARAQ